MTEVSCWTIIKIHKQNFVYIQRQLNEPEQSRTMKTHQPEHVGRSGLDAGAEAVMVAGHLPPHLGVARVQMILGNVLAVEPRTWDAQNRCTISDLLCRFCRTSDLRRTEQLYTLRSPVQIL